MTAKPALSPAQLIRRLQAENRALRRRVRAGEEAEQALAAIRQGAVDAVIVAGPAGDQVYTLEGGERPYRVLLEALSAGAMTLAPDGTILYANAAFAELLGLPLERVIGAPITRFVSRADLPLLHQLLQGSADAPAVAEITFARGRRRVPAQLALRALPDLQLHCAVVTDLTGRLAAEASLREAYTTVEARVRERTAALQASEERYRALFNSATDAIILTDPSGDGRVLEANAAACSLFGYTAEEFRGLDRAAVLEPGDERLPSLLAAREVLGRASSLLVYKRKDGSRFVGELATAIFEERPGERRAVAIIRDITERQRAAAAVQAAEERLRLAQEASRLGIHDYRVPSGEIQWDATTRALWGLPADEPVTYAAFLAGVHPEDRAATDAAVRLALDPSGDGRYAATYRVISRADGVERWVAATGQAFFEHGQAVRLVGTVLDITDRQQAERALHESEERFRRLFTHMASGFALGEAILGADGQPCDFRFVEMNDAFEAQTGLSRAILGRPISEVLPRLERRWIDRYGRVAMTGESTTFRDFNQDTGRHYEVVCYRPALRQFAIVFRDVSKEVQAEEALRRALAEKEQALATNLTLLREVHHRVKNNLQMLCDMLYLQMESLADDAKAAVLRDTYGRIYAVARLHEQLYQAMHSGRVALDEYLGRLVDGFGAIYPDVPVRVTAVEGVTLDLDRAIHVGLLVNELVTNALKHAFPGRPGEVAVALRFVGEQLELQVRDNGRGLPPEFDLAQTKSLGLRIVHILAIRLEGALAITNHEGAAFTLTFPLHAEPPVEPQ